MEVHMAPLKFASRRRQLLGVGGAEDRIDNSDRTIPRDYPFINGVEAYGSSLELRPCRPLRLGQAVDLPVWLRPPHGCIMREAQQKAKHPNTAESEPQVHG